MGGSSPARRPHIPVAVVSGLTVGIVSGILVLRSGGGARAAEGVEPDTETESSEVARAPAADPADDGPETGPQAEATDAITDAAPLAADAGPPDAGAADTIADGDEAAEPEADEPRVRTVELRFDVRPADARGVRITVEGEAVEGRVHSLEVEGRRPRVRVAVRARGFLTWARSVPAGRDRQLTIELQRPEPTDDGPGGLIDL